MPGPVLPRFDDAPRRRLDAWIDARPIRSSRRATRTTSCRAFAGALDAAKQRRRDRDSALRVHTGRDGTSARPSPSIRVARRHSRTRARDRSSRSAAGSSRYASSRASSTTPAIRWRSIDRPAPRLSRGRRNVWRARQRARELVTDRRERALCPRHCTSSPPAVHGIPIDTTVGVRRRQPASRWRAALRRRGRAHHKASSRCRSRRPPAETEQHGRSVRPAASSSLTEPRPVRWSQHRSRRRRDASASPLRSVLSSCRARRPLQYRALERAGGRKCRLRPRARQRAQWRSWCA